ncbi:proteasome subunit beta type-1-like isoform X2 [Teleopsis dalmanni]|uniref:proteasome subunit beta type-1-like isoform X2 n=1 Tax=Teleopsis dalmanni TaxID=139649 RepID=UPI0018CEF68F|nr:proteasome subunit beta type-1-like isoform X2 [Teleopsis dalmanni]
MEDPDLYENNKGTIVGIAGDDFVILAADTRICSDYSIVARAYIRVHTVPPNLLVAANGCEADANAWISDIRSFGISMQVLYDQPLIPKSAASYSFVSQYKYRLFPLNISTLIGGFDEQGKSVLYVSDSPGLYHCMPYSARGASYKPCLAYQRFC